MCLRVFGLLLTFSFSGWILTRCSGLKGSQSINSAAPSITLQPGTSQTVTIQATSQPAGTYSGSITVSGDGCGTSTVNVGSAGDAFGVADNTTLTVLDLLLFGRQRSLTW